MLPLLQRILIGLLFGIVLLFSIGIPQYLGKGAEWLTFPDSSNGDAAALEAFHDGYFSERAGDLVSALAKYRIAEVSAVRPIHYAGRRAVDRVSSELVWLGPLYSPLRTLSDWNIKLLTAIVLIGVPLLVITCVSRAMPRSGTEIRHFLVIPASLSEYSSSFDRILNEEIARIARAYHSDQLRRIGAAMTGAATRADTELSGLETRALEAISKGEPKLMIGFGLAELFRRFKNIGSRPGYILSGTLVIRPDEAIASAQLSRVGSDGAVFELTANSREVFALGVSASRSPAALASSPTLILSADPRQDAQLVVAAAVVLACKLFVAWNELVKALPREDRPASWRSVEDFADALNHFEMAR